MAPLIPAKAGTQAFSVLRMIGEGLGGLESVKTQNAWVPVFAGMSGGGRVLGVFKGFCSPLTSAKPPSMTLVRIDTRITRPA